MSGRWLHEAAQASMEATRLNQRMGVLHDRPVDVFLLAQKLGIWLAAQPLDGAFGFYLRLGETAGIVVNSRHPESLQRFTCAHELGHHVLGHDSHTDDATTIGRYSDIAKQEFEAQVFAASLLMPLPLVRRVLDEVEIDKKGATASTVYAFSRTIGVSYAAAAWQLRQFGLVSSADAAKLVKGGAAAAKTELRGTTWVEDARADVWMIGRDWNGRSVECKVGDEVHLRLPEDHSLGRVWFLDNDEPQMTDAVESVTGPVWNGLGRIQLGPIGASPRSGRAATGLDVVRDEHLAADADSDSRSIAEQSPRQQALQTPAGDGSDADELDARIRPAGRRAIVFVPRRPGHYSVNLSLRPAWAQQLPRTGHMRFEVIAAARKRIEGQGYAAPQRDLYAERLRAA